MSAETLYELMATQRAIRRLRADPVPEEVLRRVLRAATYAPSGGNQQPWRMVLVRAAEKKRRLGELHARRWARFAEGYRQRFADASAEERARQERTLAAGDHLAGNFERIPAVVVVCFNPKQMAITDAGRDRVSVVGGASIYPAVQNLMLACRAEGVGCVLTTLLCLDEDEIKTLLAIPDDWYTAAAVPLGYPVGRGYGPITRRDVAELCYEDRWAQPFGS